MVGEAASRYRSEWYSWNTTTTQAVGVTRMHFTINEQNGSPVRVEDQQGLGFPVVDNALFSSTSCRTSDTWPILGRYRVAVCPLCSYCKRTLTIASFRFAVVPSLTASTWSVQLVSSTAHLLSTLSTLSPRPPHQLAQARTTFGRSSLMRIRPGRSGLCRSSSTRAARTAILRCSGCRLLSSRFVEATRHRARLGYVRSMICVSSEVDTSLLRTWDYVDFLGSWNTDAIATPSCSYALDGESGTMMTCE
jgi:hypothetical protein